jgi:hypothetical protein
MEEAVRDYFNGNKGTFVIVYGKASGFQEFVQNTYQVSDMLRDGANNDDGVIIILKKWAGEVIDMRVEKPPLVRGQKELLKNVSHNVEKEGGKGVPPDEDL